jgi:thioredoxin-like negative regulator of GroEL
LQTAQRRSTGLTPFLDRVLNRRIISLALKSVLLAMPRMAAISSTVHPIEALVELDAILPIRVEVQGQRHPDTLATRLLRAKVLSDLGRNDEALAELDAILPIRVEVQGQRHRDTLATRRLRAEVLKNLGRKDEPAAVK